jgi:hypothetical protein
MRQSGIRQGGFRSRKIEDDRYAAATRAPSATRPAPDCHWARIGAWKLT